MKKNVVIIGGGASGMISAGIAAENGHNVTLIEKNEKLGKKILITGKGRCNITNAVDAETLLSQVASNKNFLYSAFYSFDADATISFFEKLGLETKVERGNRVFPVSDNAADVVFALAKFLDRNNVKVCLKTEVEDIKINGGKVTSVVCSNGRTFAANNVIVATGGLSYPTTGSSGDGYKFAKASGHNVTKLNPSLVPLISEDVWVPNLQGLSLKNVGINVIVNGKSVYKDFGEMLFTHFGVSGPIVLSASRALVGKFNQSPILSIDLKPALSEKELDARLLRDFDTYKNKDFINALDDLLPQKLIETFVLRTGLDARQKVHDINKEQRKLIGHLLKNFTVSIKDTRGYKEAVVTCGGVSVTEIDPSTMQSKIVDGLSFTGEVLDLDAYTGGFNLQIAFSTGFLAGSAI